VIDPRRDCETYLDIARENDMVITHILETHRNEDYVTGSAELQALTGARILHGDLDFGYGATITDGREIELGSIVLRAISTPGHTPESMCYGIVDREGGLETVGAFTGDTLLVGGVGRTDLLGPENIEEMSAMQYDSIFGRLLPLGDGVVIFPAHGAGSVCGSNIASREDSTIGLEKAQNPWLQVGGKEEFIALKRNEMLERPYYFDRMEEVNLKGQPLLGRLPVAPPVRAEDVWRSYGDLAIVDVRSPTSYAASHIPGSISLPLEILPHYGGWIVPYDRPVLLVTDGQEQLAPSIRALVRTGYDDIWGHLQGGMVAWHAATLPTSSFPVWSASAIGERKDGDLFYLDIRMGKEWNEVRAPDAHHIFVGHLPSRIDEVPGDRDIVILCSTGMRGSLAASILKARGRSPINLLGGLTGWMRAGLPISYISM
jgi:hydroxyacylglutathione hydrolase